MRDILIGPGPDGDYGRRRAQREAERRFKLGLCQHCSHTEEAHRAIATAIGVTLMCPTAFYRAPEEPKP